MPKIKISLPPKCDVKVKKGERIKKNDILAKGADEGELKVVALAALLKTKPQLLGKNLVKTVGGKIQQGERLAVKKGALGLSTRVVLSPLTGHIEFLDEKTGMVGIRQKGNDFDIKAPVDGRVSDIASDFVEIEVGENVFNAKRGEGDSAEGELINGDIFSKIISNKTSEACFENKIVLISKLDRLSLARALGLNALGVISLSTIGDCLSDTRERGFRISFLETDSEVFENLAKHIGKKVLLMPKEKLIVLL